MTCGAGPSSARIGPGLFAFVVGPSGAGKDAIIRAARDALAGDGRFFFPQRVVTRPASEHEDNIHVAAAEFERLKAEGAFALSWDAHGHRYGVPVAVDEALRSGRAVLCNVSRAVIAAARERYQHVLVVEISAPPEILATRLVGRARPSDGDVLQRLGRRAPDDVKPNLVIHNISTISESRDRLVAAMLANAPRC